MPEGLERVGVHLPSLLAYLVNFLVLLGVLYALAYRPLLRLLRERTERIERGLLEAEEARQAKASILEERQRILDTARREALGLVEDARRRAEEEAAREGERASEERDASLRRARRVREEDRRQALKELVDTGSDLVALAAEKVLGQVVDPEVHRQVIKAALREVASLSPAARTRDAGLAWVASAVPLNAEEMDQVRRAVASIAGRPVPVIQRTDARLLGGLAISMGDTLIDASVAGRLHRMRRDMRESREEPPPAPQPPESALDRPDVAGPLGESKQSSSAVAPPSREEEG